MINQGLTVGGLRDALAELPEDHAVYYDFGSLVPTTIASYRGYYEDASLGWTELSATHGPVRASATVPEPPTAGELVAHLSERLGKTMEGWKGGTYPIRDRTTLWVANSGMSSGTFIKKVRAAGEHRAFLVTRQDYNEGPTPRRRRSHEERAC